VSSDLRRPSLHNARRFFPRVPQAVQVAIVLWGLATTTACSGAVPSPASELSAGQAVMDLGTLVGELREENAVMQAQLDSLRHALAYQDTIVRQLAAGAGVSVRSPLFPAP
jgi:hypothetical protein